MIFVSVSKNRNVHIIYETYNYEVQTSILKILMKQCMSPTGSEINKFQRRILVSLVRLDQLASKLTIICPFVPLHTPKTYFCSTSYISNHMGEKQKKLFYIETNTLTIAGRKL